MTETIVDEFMPLIKGCLPADYETGCKEQRRYCATWLLKFLKRHESPHKVSGDIVILDDVVWPSVKRIAEGKE